MEFNIGKEIPGKPGRRLISVADGMDLFKEVLVSEQRLRELHAAWAPDMAKIIGDGHEYARVPGAARDANEALSFVIGQTTYTEAKVRERLYLPMQYRQLMTVTGEAGEWADNIRFEKEDGVGEADWGSDKGDDFPYVDVQYDDENHSVAHGRIGYFYTLQELRQTAYLRRPLNERRLVKATQAAERALNKAALFGIASKNIKGFLNQSTCPQIAVGSTNGTSLTGNWDAATADTILYDLNFGLNYVFTAMGFNYVATDIGVPVQAWNRIVSTARSTYSDTTIFTFLVKNNISQATMEVNVRIRPIWGLDTAGAATTGGAVSGSNSRAVFWVNNEDMAVFHVPMPLRFQAPQLVNLRVNVPGEQRCGGYELRYPKSMLYMDKVLGTGGSAH
jgi:hypothetical protein